MKILCETLSVDYHILGMEELEMHKSVNEKDIKDCDIAKIEEMWSLD